MDIFMPIAICIFFLILFSICGWCCKRKREGTVYGLGPNVTVTTQHTSAVVSPPYPVDDRQPMPQLVGPPAPGFTGHATPYSAHPPFPQPGVSPYPPTSGAFPYPPAAGATPYPPAGPTPYPTDGPGNYSANPPPYDIAVSTPPIHPPPVREAYGKQAPYNPNY